MLLEEFVLPKESYSGSFPEEGSSGRINYSSGRRFFWKVTERKFFRKVIERRFFR